MVLVLALLLLLLLLLLAAAVVAGAGAVAAASLLVVVMTDFTQSNYELAAEAQIAAAKRYHLSFCCDVWH